LSAVYGTLKSAPGHSLLHVLDWRIVEMRPREVAQKSVLNCSVWNCPNVCSPIRSLRMSTCGSRVYTIRIPDRAEKKEMKQFIVYLLWKPN
uniref:Exostosin domain-containing protein n=1 Tax=Echinostoma caproni TaxID=27848 RepID=A0A183A8D7_9TREM